MANYRYSFGMIVFNGDEFLQQALDSIYDFAYQIIIAEGSDRNSLPFANEDGSSTDCTVQIIKEYPDPDRKITLIQSTWKNKTDQANAWIEHATGDYVWQIDDDEIYRKDDLLAVDSLLRDRPETTAICFHWCHFFGGLDRVRPINDKTPVVWRLFRFRPGYRWYGHRPPDILDEEGRSLREISPIMAKELGDKGIYIYHFSYITDRQVREKVRYMERVRMHEYDFGMEIHPLWKPYKRLEMAASRVAALRPLAALAAYYLQRWKTKPKAIELRKRADKSWNYRYYEDVWLPWKQNPAAIEGRGVLSLNTGLYSETEQFLDRLPDAVLSHPLAQAQKEKECLGGKLC